MFKDILLCGAGLVAIFAVPAIVVALIWRRARLRETTAADAWSQLAGDLGLSYESKRNFLGMPVAGSLNGEHRGRGVFLTSIRETPPFQEEKWFFRLLIGLDKHHAGELSFAKKGAFTKLASIVRGDPITTDDPQFDELFVIRADSDIGARSVFSSASLREKLINGPITSFEVREDRIESTFPPRAYDAQHWRTVLGLLCDVAEAVESSTSTVNKLQ